MRRRLVEVGKRSNRPAPALMTIAVTVGLVGGMLPCGVSRAAQNGAWDYALKRNETGAPQAVWARAKGRGGSILWLSCSKRLSDEDGKATVTHAATVSQKRYLGPSGAKGRSTVYWFDDGTPNVSSWIYNDRYGQLIGPEKVDAFLQSLASSETLVIELSDYRYVGLNAEFDLRPDETKAIAGRFSEDCRKLAGT
jgi:hypothetical protein